MKVKSSTGRSARLPCSSLGSRCSEGKVLWHRTDGSDGLVCVHVEGKVEPRRRKWRALTGGRCVWGESSRPGEEVVAGWANGGAQRGEGADGSANKPSSSKK